MRVGWDKLDEKHDVIMEKFSLKTRNYLKKKTIRSYT